MAGGHPEAIAALRASRERHPTDPTLRRGLEAARAAVPYPPGLTAPSLDGWRHLVSPLDLLVLSGMSGLVVVAGGVLSKLGSTRRGGAVAAVGVAGWAAVVAIAALSEHERRDAAARPTLVVAVETTLRAGNGPSFPPRLAVSLPPGVECELLHRRGGWVQVQLHDGTPDGLAGWLPEGDVIAVDAAARMAP